MNELEKMAEEYARQHTFDGDQIDLYNECHSGKIKAFVAGAKWQEEQMLKKSGEYWLSHLKGFLGEGLAENVIKEYVEHMKKN